MNPFDTQVKRRSSGPQSPGPAPRAPTTFSPTKSCINVKSSSRSRRTSGTELQLSPSSISDWNEKSIWETRQKAQAQANANVPRPAREGYEWIWFPEGYWAERKEIDSPSKEQKSNWFGRSLERHHSHSPERRKSSSKPKITTSTSFDSQLSAPVRDRRKQDSDGGSQTSSASKFRRGLQYMSPTYPHFRSPGGEPEGLYCRTRRTLGIPAKKNAIVHIDMPNTLGHAGSASQTTMLLEGATKYLDHSNSRAATDMSSSQNSRRGFVLAPWHQRRRSQESFLSATSSVRRLLRGGTPVPTPVSVGTTYEDHEGKRYSKVEISSPGAPDFLQSYDHIETLSDYAVYEHAHAHAKEASRIDTPQDSAELSSDYSEYFRDDYTAANAARVLLQNIASSSSSPKKRRTQTEKSTSPFNRDSPASDQSSEFALNIPEHLPTSPLCPRNPKHPSGGTGICVYHGRQKTTLGESQHTESHLRTEQT